MLLFLEELVFFKCVCPPQTGHFENIVPCYAIRKFKCPPVSFSEAFISELLPLWVLVIGVQVDSADVCRWALMLTCPCDSSRIRHCPAFPKYFADLEYGGTLRGTGIMEYARVLLCL